MVKPWAQLSFPIIDILFSALNHSAPYFHPESFPSILMTLAIIGVQDCNIYKKYLFISLLACFIKKYLIMCLFSQFLSMFVSHSFDDVIDLLIGTELMMSHLWEELKSPFSPWPNSTWPRDTMIDSSIVEENKETLLQLI